MGTRNDADATQHTLESCPAWAHGLCNAVSSRREVHGQGCQENPTRSGGATYA